MINQNIVEKNNSKKLISTTELANQLNCNNNTITENAKKLFPNKEFVNGKTTYYTQEEATIIIEKIKNNNNNQINLSRSSIGISTQLTPMLKIQKAMELFKEGYEEELARIKAENTQLKQEAEQQKPLVEYASSVNNSNNCVDFSQFAKNTYDKLKMGRNRLFFRCKELGILRWNNEPYQQFIDNGYFKVITQTYETCYGTEKTSNKTLITGTGQIWLLNRLINKE